MWKLIIIDDQHQETVVNLVRDEYRIGRSEGHAIRLTERNVSRLHAIILRKKNGFLLEDQSSYNGVYVNGVRVAGRQDLAHGDLIQLGDYRIHVVDEAIETQEQGYRPISQSLHGMETRQLPHRLVQLIGPEQGQEYPLLGERLLIGRGPECDFVIDHGSVSRVHAEVRVIAKDRFEIIDKGSANGLRINARDLNRGILDGRDVIEVGDVVLKYIPRGQAFSASADEGATIAALAGSTPPPPEEEPRTSLAPGILAALAGASLVLLAVLFLWKKQPAPETTAAPASIQSAAAFLDSGRLLETVEMLDVATDEERKLESYQRLEEQWAQAALKIVPGSVSEDDQRELLDKVAKRESLPKPLRRQAQKLLNSSMEQDAVDLSGIEFNEGDQEAP